MYIAIDTNSLPEGFRLNSPRVRTFIKFLEDTNSKLLLAEVVRIELGARFQRDCDKAVDHLDTAFRKIQNLGINIAPLEKETLIAECGSARENFAGSRLPESILTRMPLRNEVMEEVVHRLSERRRPASDDGEEFRDCVLWSDLLHSLQ